ncbi:MAG: hypothetical protein QW334_00425 [Thermofilum sp.]
MRKERKIRFGFGNRKNPPPPESPRIAKLLETVSSLKRWELVKILWLDACVGRRKNPAKLLNKDFATYAEQVGYYLTCLTDHRYNEYHLIVALERIDEVPEEELRIDIFCVPLPMIRKIVRLEEKEMKITVKGKAYVKTPIPTLKLKYAKIIPDSTGGAKLILAKKVKE